MSYVFDLTHKGRVLAFTTQGGHITGDLMKNINGVQPRVIERLQEEVKLDNTLGRIIDIDNFTFVIARKHYNSRPSIKEMEALLATLPEGVHYKTTKETFPSMCAALDSRYVLMCGGSSWEYGKTFWKSKK